jgi:aspartyl-tRNA(Asn)/glutamyl-tRNA(Gln) amidotransferase subunit A
MSDPTAWTLLEAAAAIRERRISSEELTRACLGRVARAQPRLNAFIAVDEGAVGAARDADAALARGEATGPLHGVPLAHKDMFYRAGKVTTCGSRIRAEFVARTTATVLSRLDAAGAVTLGRLNMSEFAMGPAGHNFHFGPARNPWNPDYITGGSSSGSGAAVAGRLAFGALGSDTGGSVRLPAAICGVVGLKPTQGRVSRAGVMGLSFSMDNVGPLARTAADVAVLFAVIAGADPADVTCSTRPVVAPRLDGDLAGLRIGVPTGWLTDLDPQVAAALEDSRGVLRDLGAELIEVAVPDLGPIAELAALVSMTEAAGLHQDWLRDRGGDYGPQVRARLLVGLRVPAALYQRAVQLRAVLLRAAHDAAFTRCDVLHMPVLPGPVPTQAEADVGAGPNMAAVVGNLSRFTRPISYLGLPALSQPIGFEAAGLPIGMQLVGKPFDEATLMRVGAAYERATEWTKRQPSEPHA